MQGRFFIHRLQNVGATGLQRSWTDNLLWHHTTHLIDFGLWMVCGGDLATAEDRIRRVHSVYPPIDAAHRHPDGAGRWWSRPTTTRRSSCTGSYYSGEYVYDTLVVTDRDSYRTDERRPRSSTGDGEQHIASEQQNAELIAPDFVRGRREGREPAVPGWSVLPAMRVLHRVQEDWDARHGAQVLPGRPVT